jgi:hypothetical protein
MSPTQGTRLEVKDYYAVMAAHRITKRRHLLIIEGVLESRRLEHEVTGSGNVDVQIDEERKVRTLSRQGNPLAAVGQSEWRQLHEADESGGSCNSNVELLLLASLCAFVRCV